MTLSIDLTTPVIFNASDARSPRVATALAGQFLKLTGVECVDAYARLV